MATETAPDLVQIETPHGVFWTREDDFVTAQLREYGGHQRSELGILLSFVRPGDTVCDIGAHIGTFSIPLARGVGPGGGRVFAFEPVDSSLRILEKNVAANGLVGCVQTVHAIVTDQPGEYRLEFAGDHTSAASFSLAGARGSGPSIPTLRFDEWAASSAIALQRLDVMKIDTEGMELRVLRSAASAIGSHRPVIMTEMSGAHLGRQGDSIHGVARFLAGFGYHFFRNLGPRHARNEDFALERLLSPSHGADFFDLVAVHPNSDRYPTAASGPWLPLARWVTRRALAAPAAVWRRLAS